jgi:hypothetical protein
MFSVSISVWKIAPFGDELFTYFKFVDKISVMHDRDLSQFVLGKNRLGISLRLTPGSRVAVMPYRTTSLHTIECCLRKDIGDHPAFRASYRSRATYDGGDRYPSRVTTFGLSVDKAGAVYRQTHRIDNGGEVEKLRLVDGKVQIDSVPGTETAAPAAYVLESCGTVPESAPFAL